MHRLSTVEDCDRLFRHEGGRVVDERTAAEILSSRMYFCGLKQVFFNNQDGFITC